MPYPAFDGTQPCRDLDPELFFPKNSKESWYHPLQTRPACDECPFLEECLAYALANDVSGFWGGMTHADRKEERKRLGIHAAPVWVSDARMVRDLLVELDDGETNSKVIAGQVGCSAATVQRWRRQQRGAA